MTPPPHPTSSHRPRASAPRRLLRRLVIVVLAGLLLAIGSFGARWYLTRRSLGWQVRRGLQVLERADTPLKVRAALDHWETETRPSWEARTDELITLLYWRYPLEDQRVRLLLSRVAGADYGNRREDWKRWFDARRQLQRGLSPRVAQGEAVALRPRWVAPVGLTAWFTTILPLDGQIYVASLGTGFNDSADTADGIVRVDGASGAAELFFMPPPEHRGPRDVIGIAAGDNVLFAACYNGSVYCVDARGHVLWHAHAGDPIVAPPLAADTNQDSVTDVVVVTRAGKVLALSGRQGKTSWVASVARPAADQSLLGATLSLGNVVGQAGPELLVTLPPGQCHALALRTGRSLWSHELATGTVSGAFGAAYRNASGPPAYIGDRAGNVWSLVGVAQTPALRNTGRTVEPVRWYALATRRDETLVAGLRMLARTRVPPGEGAATPLVLACLTREYAGNWGAVCALAADGPRWRWPVGGAIWATPAVADLNADRQSEIVVASIETLGDDQAVGVVSIVSAAGHCLRRMTVDAPIECSPVVADVDGDGRLEILVADQSGRLHCFATDGFGPVEWGLYGGDSHNTRNAANAYDYGQRAYGYQWQWRP